MKRKTTIVVLGKGVFESDSFEDAVRLASISEKPRLDGHVVREAVREEHVIRATTVCGEVVVIDLPLVDGQHDTKSPVSCPRCSK